MVRIYRSKLALKMLGKTRVRLSVTVPVTVPVTARVRVRREFVTCPIRGSNSVTVFVTSKRYRQTNSAQALKEG